MPNHTTWSALPLSPRPRRGGALLIALSLGALPSLAAAQALPFGFQEGDEDLDPYLINPATNAMTISWRTAEEERGLLWYRQAGQSAYQGVEEDSIKEQHHVEVTGLRPGTSYEYYVDTGGREISRCIDPANPCSFRTIESVSSDPTYRFIFIADEHNHGNFSLFSPLISALNPDFIVGGGDQVDGGTDWWENDDTFLSQWRDFMSTDPLLSEVPMIYAAGNHDYQEGAVQYDDTKDAWFLEVARTEAQRLNSGDPGYGRWYAQRYKDTLILVLDSFYPFTEEGMEPEYGQAEWLEDVLADATDGVDDPEFIMATFHFSAHCPGKHHWEPLRRNVQRKIIQPLIQAGAELILTGHEHQVCVDSSRDENTLMVATITGSSPRETKPTADLPFNPDLAHYYTSEDNVNGASYRYIASFDVGDGKIEGTHYRIDRNQPGPVTTDSFEELQHMCYQRAPGQTAAQWWVTAPGVSCTFE